jgi:hypothetical protein
VQFILDHVLGPAAKSMSVMQDVQLLLLLQAPNTLQQTILLADSVPLLLTSGDGTRGIHYVLVTNVDIEGMSLTVTDPLQSSSSVGGFLRGRMRDIGWVCVWNHTA